MKWEFKRVQLKFITAVKVLEFLYKRFIGRKLAWCKGLKTHLEASFAGQGTCFLRLLKAGTYVLYFVKHIVHILLNFVKEK